MTWRVAQSLLILRDEVNRFAPHRNKASDGSIGDAAHAARTSDHNPYIKDRNGVGVVRALDVTHDPQGGFDAKDLAEHVRTLGARGNNRPRYVIWNRRIASATSSWNWRAYTGSNPHTKHVHISVVEAASGYDSKAPWGFKGTKARKWTRADRLPLEQGDKDGDKKLVSKLQEPLRIDVDGFFGPKTDSAVRRYQSTHDEEGNKVEEGRGLVVDGIVGKKTWGALFPNE
jgi:peptidoglycan hydrolase-like protein with peptidoglycan-binding domain